MLHRMLPSQRIELKTKEIQTRNAAAAIGKKSKKCNAADSQKQVWNSINSLKQMEVLQANRGSRPTNLI